MRSQNGHGSGIFPEWERIRKIGEGSYGTVYEIHRKNFDYTEADALKIITIPRSRAEIEDLRGDGYDNDSIRARFYSYLRDIIQEYNVMSRLKGHRNIVLCSDLQYVPHEDGIGWDIGIKMELLTPILTLPERDFTEQQIIQLGIDLCCALEECRKEHIIHRDIKPQNIFQARSGDFKLGDFGIAKVVDRTTRGTKAGTYRYMAPEVYNNEPYGPSADLYSLGMVLYWLLNRRRMPFLPLTVPTPDEEDAALRDRMKGKRIPPPAYGSEALKQIVLMACEFSPGHRYETPTQMKHALKQLAVSPQPDVLSRENDKYGTVKASEIFVSGPSLPTPTPPVAPVKKRRLWLLGAAAAAGCLLAWVLWLSPWQQEPQTPQISAIRPTAAAAPTTEAAPPETSPAVETAVPPETAGGLAVRTPIAAGTNYTLAVLRDGSVITTGQNDFKQANVAAWKNVVDLDAGWRHSAALLADGTVTAAGANDQGQCNVTGWTDVVDVDVGWLHTVALRSDGTVLATGSNQFGQCDVASWTDIVAVSAGFAYTVGLKSDGTLVCVGHNSDGECDVSGIRNAVAVCAGADHTVALHADGTVTAVGGNDYGECAVSQWRDITAIAASSSFTIGLKSDGTIVTAGSGLPDGFDPASWSQIAAISAGQDHILGLRWDGTLVSAGTNRFGECDTAYWKNLILPGEPFSSSPVDRTGFEQAVPVAISAGCLHSLVLRSDGTVQAAGSNIDGQCNVSTWRDITAVSAGEYHSLGLRTDGTVLVTGKNEFGQCNVAGWNSLVSVAAGTRHSVGLRSDGTVVAVGDNKDGQCNVSAWRDIIAIAAGYKHTVGLRSDGTVVATGLNSEGQCNVSAWRDITAISSEGWHTVGIRPDGTVVATGRNKQEQCDVSGWSEIVQIAAEGWHTVGLRRDGTVLAVGSRTTGMCDVFGWTDIVSIAAGNDHTLGLRADGTLVAVGENNTGQYSFFGWTIHGTDSPVGEGRCVTGVITGNKVNIREKADISSNVEGSLKKGDYVPVYSIKGDWVCTDNGWVMSTWVSIVRH